MSHLFSSLVLLILFTACRPVQINNTVYQVEWQADSIALPAEIKDADKEFSGLYIAGNKLYLLPECRLQEKQEAVIYAMELSDFDKMMNGQLSNVPFTKYYLEGLQHLADAMQRQGQQYEGLEAIVINGESIYLSVETTTPSPDCFLLKGKFSNGNIKLDTNILTPVNKPLDHQGKRIYNAGFESMELNGNRLYCIYEFNEFEKNYVYYFDTSLNLLSKDSVSLPNIPFRLTDIKITGKNNTTAINFFYSGGGKDAVYRPSQADSISYKLVHDSTGFKSFCRLVNITFNSNGFAYNIDRSLPLKYQAYNWEGIANYKSGFFLINDRYTAAKPYHTVLLYIKNP